MRTAKKIIIAYCPFTFSVNCGTVSFISNLLDPYSSV